MTDNAQQRAIVFQIKTTPTCSRLWVSLLMGTVLQFVSGCGTAQLRHSSLETEIHGSLAAAAHTIRYHQEAHGFDRRLAALSVLARQAPEVFIAIVTNSCQKDDIRKMAAIALGKSEREGNVASLVSIAESSQDETTRWYAINGLGFCRSVAAEDCLLRCLGKYPSESSIIMRAMGEEGSDIFVPTLLACVFLGDKRYINDGEVIQSLSRIGSAGARDGLIALLAHSDLGIRRTASAELGTLENVPVRAFQALLASTNMEARCSAIEALGFLRDKSVRPYLSELTSDPSSRIRTSAIAALGHQAELGPTTSVAEWIERGTRDPSADVRNQAYLTLWYDLKQHDWSLIEQMQKDTSEDVRRSAKALAETLEQHSVEPGN